jgi:flavodoxin
MKTAIVYDSAYGNTQKIARACEAALTSGATLLRAADAGPPDVEGVGLLLVGSPTQGGRPTAEVQAFLKRLPSGSLEGKAVAAFDTRIAFGEQAWPLKLLMKVIGFAAPRIAADLKAKGGALIGDPEGFIVQGKEGPLRAGEAERASLWARNVADLAQVGSPKA